MKNKTPLILVAMLMFVSVASAETIYQEDADSYVFNVTENVTWVNPNNCIDNNILTYGQGTTTDLPSAPDHWADMYANYTWSNNYILPIVEITESGRFSSSTYNTSEYFNPVPSSCKVLNTLQLRYRETMGYGPWTGGLSVSCWNGTDWYELVPTRYYTALLYEEGVYWDIGTCGDGIVAGTEECDGGACCSPTCTFLTSATTCRASAGECDAAETCSGLSATCSVDSYKPDNTICSNAGGKCQSGECVTPSEGIVKKKLHSNSHKTFTHHWGWLEKKHELYLRFRI